MVVHLHTHSYFSLLEALPSPGELAQAAGRSGMSTLALTDHWLLTGAVEFVLACKQTGVRPILGLEIDIRQAGWCISISPVGCR